MVKIIDEGILDTTKIRDLAGSLRLLESKSLELIPILEGLIKKRVEGNVFPPGAMKYRTEGGVLILEKEFATLQLALYDARKRIKPALKTLKKSLR